MKPAQAQREKTQKHQFKRSALQTEWSKTLWKIHRIKGAAQQLIHCAAEMRFTKTTVELIKAREIIINQLKQDYELEKQYLKNLSRQEGIDSKP